MHKGGAGVFLHVWSQQPSHNFVSVDKQQQKSSNSFLPNQPSLFSAVFIVTTTTPCSECHPSCLTSLLLQSAENASHLNGREKLKFVSALLSGQRVSWTHAGETWLDTEDIFDLWSNIRRKCPVRSHGTLLGFGCHLQAALGITFPTHTTYKP